MTHIDPTSLTLTERKALVSAIEFFGTGQHPCPTENNLQHFTTTYASECIDLADELTGPDHPLYADVQSLKEKLK